MKDIKKISALLAAYNEKDNVEELARRLAAVFNKLRIEFEILFILRGNDGSYESLLNLKNEITTLRVLRCEKDGLGTAFKYGFNEIAKDTSHVITLDADLNHMPEEILLFIKRYNQGEADIIIGSRWIKGSKIFKRPFLKRIISHLGNLLGPFVYRLGVKDITSGYRFMESNVAREIGSMLESKNFEFLPEFLIKAKKMGYKFAEVPIDFRPRTKGKSKMDILQTVFGYAKLTFKQVKVFLRNPK